MSHLDMPTLPTDASIGAFLSARRKAIMGLLSIAGVLTSGRLGADIVVQSIIGFLGAYGIHEIAND